MSNQINYINNIKSDNDLNNLYNVDDYVNKISQIYNNDSDVVVIKKEKKVKIEDINIIKEFHCDRCNT